MKSSNGSSLRTRKRRRVDANASVPDTVTDKFITAVNLLTGDSPKEVYLRQELLSKFVSDDTDPADVRYQRAINKWLAVERENAATEDRLLITSEEYNILHRASYGRLLTLIRGNILKVLGDTVPVDCLDGQFTGGATTTKSRTWSHPTTKYIGQADITASARKWWDLMFEACHLWQDLPKSFEIREIPGNIMFTVPKSTTIDRVAAKEPDLNMYLQRGVGNFIRRRLRRVGINLNDQSRNRELARLGSITGSLATLDLSSASDSVTSILVQLLLPECWFDLLRDLRSPYTFIKYEGLDNPFREMKNQTLADSFGETGWHYNHMFSSMGNGFTFELESLLFWAIAKGTRDLLGYSGVVSVYGDDIIVESNYAEDLKWVLGWFGFTVNDEKTHITGPFRESCGGHYHYGDDITPFYLRGPIRNLRDVMKMANQVRGWSRMSDGTILDPTLEPLWWYLKSLVPPELWGGTELGSTDQLVSFDFPNKRLITLKKEIDTGLGGYLYWLDSRRDRPQGGDVLVTSKRYVESTTSVMRKVKAEVRLVEQVFFDEGACTIPRRPE